MTLNSTFEWFPFTPRDWLDGTRELTLEERGAYIDMICLQMLRQRPIKEDFGWLAHELHVSKQKARKLVSTLIAEMKFRRTPDGGLSNERCEAELMRRRNISHKNSQNAQKRWSEKSQTIADDLARKLNKNNDDEVRAHKSGICDEEHADSQGLPHTDSEKSSNFSQPFSGELEKKRNKNNGNADAIGMPIRESNRKKDSPRVETQSPTTNASTSGNTAHSDEMREVSGETSEKPKRYTKSFEAFWAYFPEKKGKWKGFEAWKKMQPDERVLAMTAIPKYAADVRANPDRPVKWCQGWLNGKRWEDFDETESEGDKGPWWSDPHTVSKVTPDRWREGIGKLANGSWPVAKLGPPPGHPECVVPDAIVDELRLDRIYDRHGLRRG